VAKDSRADRLTDRKSDPGNDTPAALLLGREILSVNADAREVTLRYVARDEFANRHGTVQGGFLAAMLDSASGMALMVGLPPNMTAVTTRLDVSFLKPAALGPLLATARVLQQDVRTANVEARLTDENSVVLATANADLRIVPRRR
jgi:uncharacterized protein (TIGR00369 family)